MILSELRRFSYFLLSISISHWSNFFSKLKYIRICQLSISIGGNAKIKWMPSDFVGYVACVLPQNNWLKIQPTLVKLITIGCILMNIYKNGQWLIYKKYKRKRSLERTSVGRWLVRKVFGTVHLQLPRVNKKITSFRQNLKF